MNMAQKAFAFIEEQIRSGKTVFIQTPLRTISVTSANVAKWELIGRPLFRLSDSGLRIASGKRYNLIATPTHLLVRLSAQ